MLLELSIQNLAVIESLHISFSSGFQVMTGETGAGKSIVIDALGLLSGGRASTELIRYGASKAEIEGRFEIEADHPVWSALAGIGIDDEPGEQIIIRRDVSTNGKSTARINGRLVNLGMLRTVGAWLINIHGQHEPQSLMDVEFHLQLLDLYGETRIAPLKASYSEIYDRYMQIEREFKQLQETSQRNLHMLDLYKFQVQEIEDAALIPDELECLEEEKSRLANAQKMHNSVTRAYESLYGQNRSLDSVSHAMQSLEQASGYDKTGLQPLLELVQSAYYQLDDAAHQLRSYRENIEFNEDRLSEIEERLRLIGGLRRKYGEQITDILAYGAQIAGEIDRIENKDQHLQKLQSDRDQQLVELKRRAESLSSMRQQCAQELAEQVVRELADLHMSNTRFSVHFEQDRHIGKEGCDQVEFLISANPGEPLRSLNKIASGGEISRIMLALKTIFARMDRIPVLIFDEVDTGVSGMAAQAIAEKLSRLANDCQVFSITHLPQVACMGDTHYEIRKSIQGERTYTTIRQLSHAGRVQELARMLGSGETTRSAEKHAEEMLVMAEHKRDQRKHLQL